MVRQLTRRELSSYRKYKELGKLTDSERAKAAAPRVWRYIQTWELLRQCSPNWVSVTDVCFALDIGSRMARRLLRFMEAADLIEVVWSRPVKGKYGHDASTARVK